MSKHDIVCSIATAGDMAVGKTALIRRFCTGQFDSHQYAATTGVDIAPKTLELSNGTKLKLHIFDTAGQERFRAITPTFLRGRDAYVLVYDVTDISTLESIETDWVPLVLQYGTEACDVLLLGNKIDIPKSNHSATNTSNTIYSDAVDTAKETELIQKITSKIIDACPSSVVQHMYTSALTGEGVESSFTVLAELIVQRNLKENEAYSLGSDTSPQTTAREPSGFSVSGAVWGVWESFSSPMQTLEVARNKLTSTHRNSSETVDLRTNSKSSDVSQSQCCR